MHYTKQSGHIEMPVGELNMAGRLCTLMHQGLLRVPVSRGISISGILLSQRWYLDHSKSAKSLGYVWIHQRHVSLA